MRKILLTSTALLALPTSAHAFDVMLGGSVDFRAALFHESEKSRPAGEGPRRSRDIQSEYDFVITAQKEAPRGITYGALIEINNSQSHDAPAGLEQAYVWLESPALGKAMFGDTYGARTLFVIAPTVGEDQMAGSYTNFTDPRSLGRLQPAFVDQTLGATKLVWYSPKTAMFGEDHTLQLGVSFTPREDMAGSEVALYDNATEPKNVIEIAAQYTGIMGPANIVVSPMVVMAQSSATQRSATLWGLGAQAEYAGVTIGGSYVDGSHYGMQTGQTLPQRVWTAGLKYELGSMEFAASTMRGRGYMGYGFIGSAAKGNYVDRLSMWGLGASYNWFAGFTTTADAVFFDQKITAGEPNTGHVLMLSQKLSF
ncbi:MAG: porin [Alphaproteobacteria bacterium]|nr:porin [Alphaproteobacteria bacterium]